MALMRRVVALVVTESRRGWNDGTDAQSKNSSEQPPEKRLHGE